MIYFPGAIPSLLQILGLFFIPESPRWLVSPMYLSLEGNKE